ncbi:uroporphyrinogen-III C-methyltransferase [Vibrio navarrensis]|uniref:uroporphyrinogen-III C-methyltransferase n=1 Tax=Vibrio navarrensis TaxID=29495 RepID=UPI001869E6A9|nr:uroporphyrinogen-III C-methyltransferase [Vibrio navarrensis]MBE4574925.1 uroporphyrinogen-III C-methyltransferase [Vibrio navarrensis]MBE4576429.1 uroporphyrinogen-III C-methyltransferase [Vibrio navarrensis]MBE4588020.1 uroporphyrinogen-III C-methyltransferase [Vibrio navarrensis]MBE4595328.1 uroporphyrinogen-III C-methyltransferase [Vibrio navarrensis]MBE4599499.1 uroporphyrinogen-III C-methyltransferase [Vibrio navarrensis]
MKSITLTSVQTQGFVSLVGAGPGDPDLLTVKGYRVIQQADVVVYDRLVSAEILALASENAERIYVGKKLDYHCVPQEQINQILVDKALEGKRVVRLKGGDSFIFGRGGEELEALAEHGIRFEVVPGITAAAGATAYAGIPLTHRDHAQSVQFITGHIQKDGKEIEWASLAQANTTLVFYMGLKQSGNIAQKLLENGLDANMACAIIENGTRREQKVLRGALQDLPALAQQAVSPALIVVGSVTALHEKLKWFA